MNDKNESLMVVIEEIIGNSRSPEWKKRLENMEVDVVRLDQWTAQKSRFLARSEHGEEYPVALKRHVQVADGDILLYRPDEGKALVVSLSLSPVLVMNLSALKKKGVEEVIRVAAELGHAIGNQHWPAVVKGMNIYVPLTVDKKVMLSVMQTHHLEGVEYDFHQGSEIIPYLAPHEVRRLFGGAGRESHSHAPSAPEPKRQPVRVRYPHHHL